MELPPREPSLSLGCSHLRIPSSGFGHRSNLSGSAAVYPTDFQPSFASGAEVAPKPYPEASPVPRATSNERCGIALQSNFATVVNCFGYFLISTAWAQPLGPWNFDPSALQASPCLILSLRTPPVPGAKTCASQVQTRADNGASFRRALGGSGGDQAA